MQRADDRSASFLTAALQRADDLEHALSSDSITFQTFGESNDNPYPDTFVEFTQISGTTVSNRGSKVLLDANSLHSGPLPEVPRVVEITNETFPTTLQTCFNAANPSEELASQLSQRTYGKAQLDRLDTSETLNCTAVSLLISHFYMAANMRVSVLCSERHAIVKVDKKFIDGTRYLRKKSALEIQLEEEARNKRQEQEFVNTIKEQLSQIDGNSILKLDEYVHYIKQDGNFKTRWPDDGVEENDIKAIVGVPIVNTAEPLK